MRRTPHAPLVAARLAAALGLLALPGCFYPAQRGKALEARVDQLSADNTRLKEELQQARANLDATLPLVDQKVKEVAAALASLDTASRQSGADTGVRLQKTVEDVAQLRGQVETYLHRISELEAQLQTAQTDTERRLAAMKGEDALKAADARLKAEQLPKAATAREALAAARKEAEGGDAALARVLYQDALKRFPKDPLAGELHFGLGESWRKDEKCREALFEYGKVLQEHPKTPSAPAAYLGSSECFQGLKMTDEARLALEEVVKAYPRSPEAKTAKERLAQMTKAAPKKKAGAKPAAKKGGG